MLWIFLWVSQIWESGSTAPQGAAAGICGALHNISTYPVGKASDIIPSAGPVMSAKAGFDSAVCACCCKQNIKNYCAAVSLTL